MQVTSIAAGREAASTFSLTQQLKRMGQFIRMVMARDLGVMNVPPKGEFDTITKDQTFKLAQREQQGGFNPRLVNTMVSTDIADGLTDFKSAKIRMDHCMTTTVTSISEPDTGLTNKEFMDESEKELDKPQPEGVKTTDTSGEKKRESKPGQEIINVMIVEDDIDDFYLVRQILGRDSARKYDIVHCDCLQQSLDMLKRTKVDIILLDLGLGDSSGLETLQHMANAILFSTPIVVLTGTNDVELGERAIKVGAEDYVPKEEANTSLLSRSIRYSIERHFLLQQFQRRATTDPLTLLPNRSALMERIETLMFDVSRNHSSMAIAMMDLDGFKEINDSFGHQAGDEVLKEIAERMKTRLRCSDMAARLGGDEFVLLLTNYHNHHELIEVLQKKQKRLSLPINLTVQETVHEVSVGISIGVVEWQQGLNAHQLLGLADEAMYESKRKGKNLISISQTD